MGPLSKNQFYMVHANKRDKGNIRAAAILGYICAAATLLLGLLMQNYFIIIDVALILGFSLGVHIGKSRACAVLLLIYAIISLIISLITTGQITGWWLIIVGVCGIMGTFNFYKDYRNYLATFDQQPMISE